jgi:purine-binding chemotaxis protein CheW
MGNEDDGTTGSWLVCRSGSLLLALPIGAVVEVMRPLPAEALAGAPDFVRGVSIVRGRPTPVVDAGLLVFGRASGAGRLVSLQCGGRGFGLLVDGVIGVRSLPAAESDKPPLLRRVAAEIVSAIGLLDRELLLFLGTALVVPEALLELPLAEVATA